MHDVVGFMVVYIYYVNILISFRDEFQHGAVLQFVCVTANARSFKTSLHKIVIFHVNVKV